MKIYQKFMWPDVNWKNMPNHYMHVKPVALWNSNSWDRLKQSFQSFWRHRQLRFYTFLIWKNIWNYFNILYMLENLYHTKNIMRNIIIRLVFNTRLIYTFVPLKTQKSHLHISGGALELGFWYFIVFWYELYAKNIRAGDRILRSNTATASGYSLDYIRLGNIALTPKNTLTAQNPDNSRSQSRKWSPECQVTKTGAAYNVNFYATSSSVQLLFELHFLLFYF